MIVGDASCKQRASANQQNEKYDSSFHFHIRLTENVTRCSQVFYNYFWRLKAWPKFGSARTSKTTRSAANSVVHTVVFTPFPKPCQALFSKYHPTARRRGGAKQLESVGLAHSHLNGCSQNPSNAGTSRWFRRFLIFQMEDKSNF
jgi:hypothetical protein